MSAPGHGPLQAIFPILHTDTRRDGTNGDGETTAQAQRPTQ
jgi:hypothetical protein